MNGADLFIDSLLANGIDTCFTNPGTSEMHFVEGLDRHHSMRGILTLFEGVASGAADGYARMLDRPAATLLHLGPGLANGLANLHNARRAHSPIVNIVGEHATFHRELDAPLESDIESLARVVSGWWRTCEFTDSIIDDVTDAVAAATGPPGQVATLVVPADVSWSQIDDPARSPHPPRTVNTPTEPTLIDAACAAIRSGEPTAMLLGGHALRREALDVAGAIAKAASVTLFAETFPSRLERGAGVVAVERLSYIADFALAQLAGIRNLVLVGAKAPVSFFAHPDVPGSLVPPGTRIIEMTTAAADQTESLRALADLIGAGDFDPATPALSRPELPTGSLDASTFALALGALLPENAVVVDEAQTSGIFTNDATAGCPPHDWLTLTGGAIGMGLPVATGVATAVPDRRVLALEADGSAVYTIQALWTQAREGLDVTTVILANRSYAILGLELERYGLDASGSRTQAMIDLSHPTIDFVAIASGMGVPASRATTTSDFNEQLARSLAAPGPSLIEAVVPSIA